MIYRLKTLIVFIILSLFICGTAGAYTVKRGDTLYDLFRGKFTPAEIINISQKIKEKVPDFTLQIGDKIEITNNKVIIKINITKEIHIVRNEDGTIMIEVVKYPVNILRTVVSGEISHSLFYAMQKVGESDILAVRMANILEWEVDFFNDIRTGDSFRLVVEKKFCRGKFIGYGKILAVDFVNQGRLIRGLYFEDEKTSGYFRPNGKSLKRGFLKSPLKFFRISSKFQNRRLHPVLGKYKDHNGVDYAAPTGTPIRATADGRVVVRGYAKANGYYIKLKHNNGYYTLYLHLSRFKRALGEGEYVKQGDIIGYVGSTGYATGPHVHYSIKKYGNYLNPLRFKAPTKKLPQAKMDEFKADTYVYAEMLDNTYMQYALRNNFSGIMFF
ncbi:Peptidase M23 [Flexistipes sinusarabici DSM 4947]|uniref:Peptidase M23 n=2 Tax=Flexistipes sinusarabici TaxID=2352 RepID=F8E760_FLESM|nr:peptidoglycan DD-metalloendopeptidase family protein [Flexistipes sinusarabici]AEI14923.1 Peptidase M23 [Flexistipes sinusarabici DSM 4947]HCW92721.1 peptidase M23 [Flexistipes sinusarabici]